MGNIRIYKSTEREAINLNLFADLCNAIYKAHNMSEYITVEDIYFDYGQNWWYTACITHDEKGDSWQTFCPRDYEIIINCTNVTDMARYADYYVEERIDSNICVDISKVA